MITASNDAQFSARWFNDRQRPMQMKTKTQKTS